MKPGREIRAYNTPGKIIKNKNNNNDFKVSNNLPFRLLLFSHCCRAIILLTVSTNVKSIFQGKRKKKKNFFFYLRGVFCVTNDAQTQTQTQTQIRTHGHGIREKMNFS